MLTVWKRISLKSVFRRFTFCCLVSLVCCWPSRPRRLTIIDLRRGVSLLLCWEPNDLFIASD